MTLNIVLIEPQIPQNTGNIARTCAATGACLHLIGPMGFTIDDAKLKRAGLDYWHMLNITYHEDTRSFFSGITDSGSNSTAGTSQQSAYSIPDTSGQNFHYFSTKAHHIYTEPCYRDNCFIFFGSETKGIDEAILRRNRDQCVRLPMISDARSLNLSNAVAIGVFEVLRQWGFPELQRHGSL